MLTGRVDPSFYEPRAIVLNRMGQHKQALEIYVFKLQDPDKAEEYDTRAIPFTINTNSILATAIRSSLLRHPPPSRPNKVSAQ